MSQRFANTLAGMKNWPENGGYTPERIMSATAKRPAEPLIKPMGEASPANVQVPIHINVTAVPSAAVGNTYLPEPATVSGWQN